MKTALIAGSTGLIGTQLLQLLLASDRYDKVIALVRRDAGVAHPKLQTLPAEFDQLDALLGNEKITDVFCCLGTTMAKAGSREKFYEVDFHYPVKLAEAAIKHGAARYYLVSALGADRKSKIYYNRVKGEVEAAISGVGYTALHIFRPSLLLGPRTETRRGEDAAKILYRVFGFLFPAKYKAIDASRVADAMMHFTHSTGQGVFIHESDEMQRLK